MIQKIEKWYTSLSNLQQLFLIFLGAWVMWFGMQPLGRWFSGEDNPVIKLKDSIYSLIMAITWTLSSAYPKVKRLFSSRKTNSQPQE